MIGSGVLLVDKAAGPSSAQTLKLISRQLKLNKDLKIGHAGTLDPFATGLLVVLLGKACRLADFFQAGVKVYSGEIQLGMTTDSDDITGSVLKTFDLSASFDQVEAAAKSFLGIYQQMPPAISALKVDGKRAYNLVRAGQTPQLKARQVELFSLDMFPVSEDIVSFRISCSKGFYVRALARDIGEKIGAGACLRSLRRVESAPFCVDAASQVGDLAPEELGAFLSMSEALKLLGIPELTLPSSYANHLKNGLVSSSFRSDFGPKLDSYGQGLVVYKDAEQEQASGVLTVTQQDIKILLNF
jgi:tRNA pseudouridine55 synthase